jgi:uncharacterized protein
VNGPPRRARSGSIARAAWAALGLAAVGLGTLGIVVPGLPTTVFFIAAAWCFSRSSPRLERWVLGLPRIGPLVRDHRAGLGMPRRTKRVAVLTLVVFVAVSVVLVGSWPLRIVVSLAGAVGVAVIVLRVPTRERVLAARSTSAP